MLYLSQVVELLFGFENGENPLKELPNLLSVVNLVGTKSGTETDKDSLYPALPHVWCSTVGKESELEDKAYNGKDD